jgi:hypothetical protein
MAAGGACLYFFFWQEIWGAAVDVKRGVQCANGNLGNDLVVFARDNRTGRWLSCLDIWECKRKYIWFSIFLFKLYEICFNRFSILFLLLY